jgi:PAS domain S-box-containing protein
MGNSDRPAQKPMGPSSFLVGGGEMGALIRGYDWNSTPLGSPDGWPQSLKTAVRIMLSSRQPIWIGWGSDLVFFYNDPYKTIIGGKHPWALGRPTRVVWSEIWDDIAPLLETAQTGTEGTYVEERLLIMERNGYEEETYYTFSYSPIPDDHGDVGGIICANSDDTARVIGERQLKLLRELAAAATNVQTVQQACRSVSAALSANRADLPFALLYLRHAELGYELASSSGIERGHPAAPSAIRDLLTSPWAPHSPDDATQVTLVRNIAELFVGTSLPTGSWQRPPHQAAIIPLAIAGDTDLDGFLVVGLNPWRLLDENYERFLLLAAGQIAGAVGHASAYQQQQQRAEELAELDRAKTAFFSNISHEFRTPLTLMLGPLEELLASASMDGRDRALIDITYRNSQRLLKLVNALLDFSRIEAGRVEVKLTAIDLASFTAELASLFHSMFDRAGLELVIDCPPLIHAVAIDRDLWERVILNLMSNAFKFTLEGRVTVRVREAQDRVEVVISDTGIGISAEELPHIFERFHRVSGANGRSIEGSGIGLALVHELVRLQGGDIEVASELNVGSSFRIAMPIAVANTVSGARPLTERASASAAAHEFVDLTSRSLSGTQSDEQTPEITTITEQPSELLARASDFVPGKVLVADDNVDLRDYMGRILRAAGYVVRVAADGQEALDVARAWLPDIVVSDVMMPRLDGFALLGALRTEPALSNTPIILLSARAGEEATVEGLRAGADDYLVKPFSAREMLARVASNLRLAQLRLATERSLREETRTLELINRVGTAVAAELDLTRAVQIVTDAATELTGAAFGAFFYNAVNEKGEIYSLYTLSGVDKSAFDGFPMPRNTAVFAPTFQGIGMVRSDDITRDARYGKSGPHHGMPAGHLPVRSYLSAPVISRTGQVLGGLFFGHPEAGQFDARAERLILGIAAQAASAIDNAQLYSKAQSEIAHRTAAEAAIRALNETLEQRVIETVAERDRMWDLSDDLLAIATFEGTFVRLSPSWFRTFGYETQELLARPYFDVVHPDDVSAMRDALDELRAKGQAVRVESRLGTSNGIWRWIAWTLTRDPNSDLVHGVGRDVTADREAQEALRHAEMAMRAAQKMEAIGQLTGGVAHDFNNLLQVIGGNLHLLSKDVVGQQRSEERVRHALSGVARGAKLASQLLAFGRRQPLAPKVVNLGRFVRGMDDMLRRALGEGIEIEAVVSGGLWNTLVDPFQVENALLNLAINARDAMRGHGQLTIEAGNASLDDAYTRINPDAVPGQYVMLAVTDTGSGIAPEIMDKVFEPFFTTKSEGKGTGLGLSMVYGFVKQSDGHIKIYSELGQGTTIRMYLPRARAEEDLLAEVDDGPVSGGSETVLVAEDDEDVRTTVVDLLTELGYKVLKAKDAQGALVIIESGIAIDLLFTDVVMPGPLRSPDLARKARERLPGIAVLFTSGYTANAIVHGGRLDEGIELLSKPYSRDAMARKIRYVLRSQQQRNAASKLLANLPASVSEAPTDLRELRVVLVEDDDLVREATTAMLRSMDIVVREAADGASAMQLVLGGPIDVMIIDIGLPDISGLELAIKAVKQQPNLSVVFASGHDVVLTDEHRAQLPNAVSLRKPYHADDLLRELRTVSGR